LLAAILNTANFEEKLVNASSFADLDLAAVRSANIADFLLTAATNVFRD
jgi:hypothetical protein